ncbi:hypothetical protein [Microvirga sp. P5_D2]
MTVQRLGAWIRVTKRAGDPLPPHRVRAADLLEALKSHDEMDRQEPEVTKPRQMIETMRIVGDDYLTASDAAIYELLLTWARHCGLNLESHEIPFSIVKSYLEVPSKKKHGETRTVRTDDLVAGLHRLSKTLVKYDVRNDEFRSRGTVPLVLAEVRESLLDGAATVSYTIPPHIRRLMLESRSYGKLELRAFAHFRCRYTVRLYQRLALRAGYDKELLKPWEIAPQQLARELGFKWSGKFRYADFRRFCLDPIRWDMEAHVRRFSVRVEEVLAEASGRGRRPIALLRFHITPETPKLATLVSGSMTAEEVRRVREHDLVLSASQIPSPGAVARTIQFLERRHTAVALSDAWRAALDEALDGVLRHDGRAPTEDDLHGESLLQVIENVGTDEAFFAWAQRSDRTGRFLRRIESLAPEVVVAQKPPVSREERRRELAHQDATQILEGLKKRFNDDFFPHWRDAWCEPEFTIWTWVSEQVPDEGNGLRHALRLIPRMTVEDSRRTLYNLASAVLADDVEKARTICTAVAAQRPVSAECPF